MFRRLQDILPGVSALVDHLRQVACGFGHPAEQRLILDDIDVLFDIGRRGSDVDELKQIAPGLVGIVAVLLHVLQHRHRINGEGVVEHGVDGLVNFTVLTEVEVVGPQLVDDLRHALGIKQDRAQHSLLRLHRVGQLLHQKLVVIQSQRTPPPFIGTVYGRELDIPPRKSQGP